jgi:uncharacterized membrane protein
VEALMRLIPIAIALLATACAPPAANEAVADNGNVAEANVESAGEKTEVAAPAVRNMIVPANAAVPGAAPAKAAAAEPYTAQGQEPGWALKIDKGRIDYQGNYGEKLINVFAPLPETIANGRRYVTPRLTVAITNKRCNDAMSGHGYEDEVKVIADGEAYQGCGGKRRTDWDM